MKQSLQLNHQWENKYLTVLIAHKNYHKYFALYVNQKTHFLYNLHNYFLSCEIFNFKKLTSCFALFNSKDSSGDASLTNNSCLVII